MSLLEKSLKDYLTPKFLGLSFATLIIPLIVLFFVLIVGGGEFFDILSQGAESGDFTFLSEEQYPILTTILKLSIVKWILVSIFYLFGGLIAVLLSLLIAIIVLGFLTPIVVATIHKRHYLELGSLRSMSTAGSWNMIIMVILKFVLLLIVAIPFMFIPLINFFAINAPFLYLFHQMMVIDVGSNMMDKSHFLSASKKHFKSLLVLSVMFFALSIIPIVGIFLQLFFAIYYTHFFFEKEIIPSKTMAN